MKRLVSAVSSVFLLVCLNATAFAAKPASDPEVEKLNQEVRMLEKQERALLKELGQRTRTLELALSKQNNEEFQQKFQKYQKQLDDYSDALTEIDNKEADTIAELNKAKGVENRKAILQKILEYKRQSVDILKKVRDIYDELVPIYK